MVIAAVEVVHRQLCGTHTGQNSPDRAVLQQNLTCIKKAFADDNLHRFLFGMQFAVAHLVGGGRFLSVMTQGHRGADTDFCFVLIKRFGVYMGGGGILCLHLIL